MEGAGIVEAVGEGVTHLKAGDRAAYASNPPGAYATARVMPAKCVLKLPDAISFETGAAMMLKGLTVQYLLRKTLPQGGLQAGDFVLFHAAAGGVGLIACQWARALGLQLIGTAGSDEKCRLALDQGATHAINYRRDADFAAKVKEITGGRGVKVVYDSVGADTWEGSLNSLAPFGLLASFGGASGPVPPFSVSTLAAKGSVYVTRPTLFTHIASREATQAMGDELFERVVSGQVKIRIDRRYALADAAQSHRDLERQGNCSAVPCGAAPERQSSASGGAWGRRELQLEAEGGADARLAFDADLAVHQADEALHDGQAQARAAVAPCDAAVGLREGVEDLPNLVARHADAGVVHSHAQAQPVGAVSFAHQFGHRDFDAHLAALGEFERVADQVDQHLAQPQRVAHQPGGHARLHARMQLDAFVMGLQQQGLQ
jgi:NADPH2:quinone reductase